MDDTLRAILAPKHGNEPQASLRPGLLLACLAFGGAIYGGAMGAYSALEGGNLVQILFSACKVPVLLALSAAISLPAAWIMYTLQGLQKDFLVAARALLEGQAALAIVLASLAPLTLVLYLSAMEYRAALLLNIGVFLLAALAAQGVIRGRIRMLLRQDSRHAQLLWVWFGLFSFVAIQLAWNLRPFVGDPRVPAQFFRADAFSNAYLQILRLLLG